MADHHAKQLHPRIKAAGQATAAQLQLINAHALSELTAEDVQVREYLLCHNGIDRDGEVLDEKLLADLARTLPGKGVFCAGHPGGWSGTGGPAGGKCYDARVEQMSFEQARAELKAPDLQFPPDRSTASVLRAFAYFVSTPDMDGFLRRLDAGIGGDVSIGFRHGGYKQITDSEGRELDAYRLEAPGEALEFSHVWLGAQTGAHAVKDASRNNARTTEQNEMNLTAEQIKALQTKADSADQLQKDLDAAKAASAAHESLRKALGDNAELADKPEALAKAVSDGLAAKNALVDDLVASDRQAGVCGDSDDAVAAQKAIYAAMPTDALRMLEKRASKAAPKPTAITGGDPNRAAPGNPDAEKSALPDALSIFA